MAYIIMVKFSKLQTFQNFKPINLHILDTFDLDNADHNLQLTTWCEQYLAVLILTTYNSWNLKTHQVEPLKTRV